MIRWYVKRGQRERFLFEGLDENTDLRDVFDRFCMVHGETDTDLQQWYDAYVDSRYRKFATDVPAVGDFITRRLALESIGYGVYEENGSIVRFAEH